MAKNDAAAADYDNNPAAVEFFSTLLAASTYAQVLHRQTVGEGSDARHRALGDFYDKLIELNDSVVEQYQGCYGLVRYKMTEREEPADALAFVSELYDYIEDARYKVCDETHIQNSIDEICSLCSQTKFRLRFLR